MRSVYRSAPGRQLVQQHYRQLLAHWPVPCEQRFVASRQGDTFVIASQRDAVSRRADASRRTVDNAATPTAR